MAQTKEEREKQKLKLKKVFHEVLRSDLRYNKSIEDLDFTVITKFLLNNEPLKVLGCDVSIFNYSFENSPAVIVVFSYCPKDDSGSKHISEKAIDVVNLLQETFITLDYVNIVDPKNEPYVYIAAIKKV